jgi:hypothetical protein
VQIPELLNEWVLHPVWDLMLLNTPVSVAVKIMPIPVFALLMDAMLFSIHLSTGFTPKKSTANPKTPKTVGALRKSRTPRADEIVP